MLVGRTFQLCNNVSIFGEGEVGRSFQNWLEETVEENQQTLLNMGVDPQQIGKQISIDAHGNVKKHNNTLNRLS